MRAASARKPKSRLHTGFFATARYIFRPESQTFALSVSTNAVLAFFPFMIVLMMLIRRVFHSPQMYHVVLQILRDHLPTGQDVVIPALNALVNVRKPVAIGSLILVFLTSKGVFMPLEVGLNRIWGFPVTRSWLHNQLMGALLAFACGGLVLLSVALAASNQYLLAEFFGGRHNPAVKLGAFVVMKIFATMASILIFFLIYWLVPNGKVAARRVLPAAILVGILWELLKYAYILLLPHLNFQEVYGPFAVSVSLMFWAYLSGLLLLAGAFVSAE